MLLPYLVQEGNALFSRKAACLTFMSVCPSMENTSDLHESRQKHITADFWGEHGTFVTVGLGQSGAFPHLQLCSGILHPSL